MCVRQRLSHPRPAAIEQHVTCCLPFHSGGGGPGQVQYGGGGSSCLRPRLCVVSWPHIAPELPSRAADWRGVLPLNTADLTPQCVCSTTALHYCCCAVVFLSTESAVAKEAPDKNADLAISENVLWQDGSIGNFITDPEPEAADAFGRQNFVGQMAAASAGMSGNASHGNTAGTSVLYSILEVLS